MDTLTTEFMQTIADFGFTVVAGAVIILIAIKVFNSLIKQNNAITESVVPKMDQVVKQLSAVENTVNEHITSHNSSSKVQLHEINTKIDKIIADQARIQSKLDQLANIETIIYAMIIKKEDASNKDSLTDMIDIYNDVQ